MFGESGSGIAERAEQVVCSMMPEQRIDLEWTRNASRVTNEMEICAAAVWNSSDGEGIEGSEAVSESAVALFGEGELSWEDTRRGVEHRGSTGRFFLSVIWNESSCI